MRSAALPGRDRGACHAAPLPERSTTPCSTCAPTTSSAECPRRSSTTRPTGTFRPLRRQQARAAKPREAPRVGVAAETRAREQEVHPRPSAERAGTSLRECHRVAGGRRADSAGVRRRTAGLLRGYADRRSFKVYALDVGLLDLRAPLLVHGDRLFEEYRGALVENYVAQQLTAAATGELHYWRSRGARRKSTSCWSGKGRSCRWK